VDGALVSSKTEGFKLMQSHQNKIDTIRHCYGKRTSYNFAAEYLPAVPHKAVAEVSKIGNYRRGEVL
jgi:hypothetical protein